MSETRSLLESLRGFVITGAAVAGLGLAGYLALPMLMGEEGHEGSEQFYKEAYDQNGVQITGPVSVGQVIQYVLRYARPLSGSIGPSTITDTLSAGQSYVPNSIVAPGWSYSTPEYLGNQETYSSPGFGSSAFTMTVPAVGGWTGAAGGGGDGYEPVPVLTSTGVKVFGVNHHQPTGGNPKIMCWYGASLAKCSPAYPKLASVLPELRSTPDIPHAAVFDKKVYYPSGRYPNVPLNSTNQQIEMGIACWDAELDMPCPFVSLPGIPTLSTGSNPINNYLGINIDPYVAGVRADPLNPSHLLVFALGTIYCVDVAVPGAPSCAGWTNATVSPTNVTGRSTDMFVEEGGTRVFFSNTVPRIFCFNISDGSVCSGWAATGTSGGATTATNLGPGIDASGNMTAICLSQSFGLSNFKCVDIATGANVSTAWPAYMTTRGIFAAFHLPGTTKVIFPPYINGLVPDCYDAATSAPCTPWSPYWRSNANWTDGGGTVQQSVKDYGYAADPVRPDTCLYGLGDRGTLVRFAPDGSAVSGGCLPETYHQTFSLDEQYCFHKPETATWTALNILNRPGELVGGTIVIKDSAGTVIQTISVSVLDTYTVNLPATGLNGTVSIEFTPSYAGGTPPTTDYGLELTYSSDENPQICYQTMVKECSNVSNEAVLENDHGSYVASVDLGETVGGECGGGSEDEKNCLEVEGVITASLGGSGVLTVTLNGPPSFGPTLVTVTALSGAVVASAEEQTFGIGQTQGSWNLTGLVPGTTATFMVDGVKEGGGIRPGTDQCCSSRIEVEIPDREINTNNPPPPPPVEDPRCERDSTELKGGLCSCRHEGMKQSSPTSCECPAGYNLVEGKGCEKPDLPACDGRTAKLKGNACVCRYQGMTKKSATVCSCPAGTKLKVGEGCVKKPLQCDPWSSEPENGTCACRYEGMKRVSPTMCECQRGQILIKDVGCVVPKQSDKPTDKGKTDTPTSTSTPPPSLDCKRPLVPNSAKTACTCPDGTELKDGACEKKSNILDDVLGNVHFGFGLGGGSNRGSSGGAPRD